MYIEQYLHIKIFFMGYLQISSSKKVEIITYNDEQKF